VTADAEGGAFQVVVCAMLLLEFLGAASMMICVDDPPIAGNDFGKGDGQQQL
jgi:hypothetical protein